MSRHHRSNETPTFESGRIERSYSANSRSASVLKQPIQSAYSNGRTMSNTSNMSTRSHSHVVKEETDLKSGNKIQLVRTIPEETESTDDIVQNLFNRYTYNYGGVRAKKEDLDNFQRAFPAHEKKIINTYEGSNMTSDTNQELIGEKYYSKQIADIKQKNKISFLEKWDHLLYQGDENYQPSIATPLPHINFSAAPTQSRTFSINSSRPTSSKTFSLNSKR